ncbi:hypothetical protein STEG23_001687 [Scotinomys teguina]
MSAPGSTEYFKKDDGHQRHSIWSLSSWQNSHLCKKLFLPGCSGWLFQLSLEVPPPLMFPITVTPLGRDQDCSLKIREPDVPASWFLDSGGWSKTTAVRLYFIFPGICTLSLEFKNFFACMMNDIILEIYDLPKSYLACTLLAFTLIIHTAFKYCLTNKKKDESLLLLMHKMILSLESANQDLQSRLNLESANLMQELQSINNKCIAKIGFVDNKYEYLMDRTLTLQSEVVTTQTLCKEERLSLIDKIRSLESCVSEEHNRWYDSMKNLESQAREEVHSLEQTLCARLQTLAETLCKHDKEPNKQKGKTIKVVTSPNASNPMAYPVIIHERPADDIHSEPYVIHTLQPISIRDFKNMKEAIVTYGIHSTYIKQMLNSWSTSNRIIPDDWHQLTSAVLEYSQQLQWKNWLREEARNLEQQGILMQMEDVILEWIFLPRKPNKKLKTYIEKISDLIHKGIAKLTSEYKNKPEMASLHHGNSESEPTTREQAWDL